MGERAEKVFAGFGLRRNYRMGDYMVDYCIPQLGLCLECNGYDHKRYDPEYEEKRQKYILKHYALVRFPHKIGLEALFNGILQAKRPGDFISLYALEKK